MNLAKIPEDSYLQPIYEDQVRNDAAFKPTYAIYQQDLVTGKETERSYQKLQQMVRQFLDIEQVNENDDAGSKKYGGDSMSMYEAS